MGLELLIQECKKKNTKAQEQLYRLFSSKLFNVCLKYSRNYAEAQDNLQDGFLLIFEKINQFEHKGSFEGWLKRIAVTSSITLNKKFNKIYFDEVKEEAKWEYAVIPEIYGEISKNEIIVLLKELPESLYLVFNMYVVEGYQHHEIAYVLGITESTSRSALCKARNRLAALIKKQDGVLVAEAS